MSSLQHIFAGDLQSPGMTSNIAPSVNLLSYPAHAEVSVVCRSYRLYFDTPVVVKAIANPFGLLFKLQDGFVYVRCTCTDGLGASLRRFDTGFQICYEAGTSDDLGQRIV
jgi:hypothetical protein